MKNTLLLLSYLLLFSFQQKEKVSKVEKYYQENCGNKKTSKSTGKVEKGKLINGKLIPFSGDNFRYFDTSSYLSGRAFLNGEVLKTVLESYKEMKVLHPKRKFCTMECSNKHGGKLFPHITHQNGLSVDFMMPKLKSNKPYYELDYIGSAHYWLTFDNNGKYSEDKNISIDFDLIGEHLLILDKTARINGYKVNKVIIKIEFKDELFSSKFGKKLKESNIYIVRKLSPLINSFHDEHYHVDFEKI